MFGYRSQTELSVKLAFRGPAQVGHDHHLRARFTGHSDGRKGRLNARIGADRTIRDRYIQILADQHPLARQLQIFH